MKGIMNVLGETMTTFGHKALFKVKKASPELLIVGGIGLIIGSTVLACKATKKANDILDEAKEEIKAIPQNEEDFDDETEEEVTALVQQNKKDISKIKVNTFGRLVATYAPSAALMGGGIAMIFASHGIMKQRNGALLAAYNAVDAAFRKYRERVQAEENGRERDRKYLIGDAAQERGPAELTESEYDDITASVNKKGAVLSHSNPYGPYTFEFSKFTTQKWSAHSTSNLLLIRSIEDWANRKLRLEGHIFLNDILKELDMEEVPWGQLCGWIRGSENGDSYVEILAIEDQKVLEMDDDGWKKPVFLTFNCDGLIWDKL